MNAIDQTYAVNPVLADAEDHKGAHDAWREDVIAEAKSEILLAKQIVAALLPAVATLLLLGAIEYSVIRIALENLISDSNPLYMRFTLFGLVGLLAAHILVLKLGEKAERATHVIAFIAILIFLPGIAALVTDGLWSGGYLAISAPPISGDMAWGSGNVTFADTAVSASLPVWLKTLALPATLSAGLILSLYASVFLFRFITERVPHARRVLRIAPELIQKGNDLRGLEHSDRDSRKVKEDWEERLTNVNKAELCAEIIAARDEGLAPDVRIVQDATVQGARARHARRGERNPDLIRKGIEHVKNTMTEEYVSEAIEAAGLGLRH